MKWTAALPAILALPCLCHGYQPLARNPLPFPSPSGHGSGQGSGHSQCKCSPVDACWPSKQKWASLNQTVGGRLQRVVPPGAVCYESFEGVPTADAEKCAVVAAQWGNSTWMADQPTIPMTTHWSNNTCEPNLAGGSGPPAGCPDQCLQGFLSPLVILAENANHIKAGVNFARQHNLRIVIRNTGHDFMGRSSGWGALVINTHRLKSIHFDGKRLSDGHTGGTVRVGAGVVFQDVYPQAWARGLDVLGGECPTVGMAGGFVQGGGQGPLSGIYGVGSDQAVSFDVVLANGDVVTANDKKNSDLFWALKGGGMGTFGIVTSATFKTYPTVPVVGMTLVIADQGDKFWEGVRIWYTQASKYTEKGMYHWYSMLDGFLQVQPMVAPNLTVAEFHAVIDPLLAQLTAANVSFTASPVQSFAKFGDLYEAMWEKTHWASGGSIFWGGRMVSQRDVRERGNDIVAAYRAMSNKYPGQVLFGGHLVNPGNGVKDPQQKISAVHPVWRDTADIEVFLYLPPPCQSAEQRAETERRVTHELSSLLRDATPHSAVYPNEGDINEPNWQSAFWGSVYPKVLKIKKKYDPKDVFWAKASTGSEGWAVRDDLKLCRV